MPPVSQTIDLRPGTPEKAWARLRKFLKVISMASVCRKVAIALSDLLMNDWIASASASTSPGTALFASTPEVPPNVLLSAPLARAAVSAALIAAAELEALLTAAISTAGSELKSWIICTPLRSITISATRSSLLRLLDKYLMSCARAVVWSRMGVLMESSTIHNGHAPRLRRARINVAELVCRHGLPLDRSGIGVDLFKG